MTQANINNSSTPMCDKKLTEVDEQINEMSNLVSNLGEKIAVLEDALYPVLNQNNARDEDPEGEMIIEIPSLCPLSARLRDINIIISHKVDFVNSLKDKVSV